MKETALLRRRILSRETSVCVVGQGYVGLTLACAAAVAGFPVTGIDLDVRRISDLRNGLLSIPGVAVEEFKAAVATGRLRFTTRFEAVEQCDIVLICVPTPLKDQAPDLSHVEDSCRQVAQRLTRARLVILESTTYPGTTEQIVGPLLEESGLVVGLDFLLAYSPERIDPGNQEFDMRNTPRLVGGVTPESTGVAVLFYEQLVDKVVVMSSCRAAEFAKLLENTFRHVNIGLVNEMAMFCHEMQIDVWEVIDATATKPFGFMPFYPGPGVGGHCIPLDPTYLAWQIRREVGHQFRVVEQAQDINAQMPGYVATRIGDALNQAGKAVNGASVLILGVSYKADVGDIRESPAMRVMALLHKRGANVSFHDPFIDSVAINGSVQPRTELTQRILAATDCLAILTPHSAYDWDWIARHAPLVFDAKNAYGPQRKPNVVRL